MQKLRRFNLMQMQKRGTNNSGQVRMQAVQCFSLVQMQKEQENLMQMQTGGEII